MDFILIQLKLVLIVL